MYQEPSLVLGDSVQEIQKKVTLTQGRSNTKQNLTHVNISFPKEVVYTGIVTDDGIILVDCHVRSDGRRKTKEELEPVKDSKGVPRSVSFLSTFKYSFKEHPSFFDAL